MKKLSYLIVLALILGLTLAGCTLLSNIGQTPTSEQSGIVYLTKGGTPGDPDIFILYADQNIDVGTVSVWDDSINLYVEYTITGDWEMTETHLYVGKTNPEDLTSAPGQFPYSAKHRPAVDTYTYTIPILAIDSYSLVKGKKWVAGENYGIDPGDQIYIAVHAKVLKLSGNNILSNPDAETGNMDNWIFSASVRAIGSAPESTGIVLPRTGGYFFDTTGCEAESADMSQEVNVAGFDGASFKVSGWIQTERYPKETDDSITANDYGRLVVTFYDNSNDELESFTTVPIGNPVYGTGSDGYAQFSLEGNIPDGAVTAIYELHGTLVLPGTYVNVFYDDLFFGGWQEETAWAEGDLFSEQGNWATYFTYLYKTELLIPAGDMFPGSVYDNIYQIPGSEGKVIVIQPNDNNVTLTVLVDGLEPNKLHKVSFDKSGIIPDVVSTAGPWETMGYFTTNGDGHGEWSYDSAGTLGIGTYTWSVFINRQVPVNATVLISYNVEFKIEQKHD